MNRWIEPIEIPVPDDLIDAVGGNLLVARTLSRRGFSHPEDAQAFLDPDCYTPSAPSELPGMAKAAERLERAIHSGESILVWGDFDVDGQTATTLLVSALRDLGGKVEYHIPVRAVESHGVSLTALKRLLDVGAGLFEPNLTNDVEAGLIGSIAKDNVGSNLVGAGLAGSIAIDNVRSRPAPTTNPIKVLLTCDTGISAHEAVAYAQKKGIDVVITDHHELLPELPAAHAVVNPKMLPDGHKMRGLPGVGVAYKLAEELYIRSKRHEEVEQFHDLVALGIVADVAPATGESRYLLQRGLIQLRNPKRIGLQAIYERAELDPTWLTEEHIGFTIAPRLNALGRLSDANPAVELFTTQDVGKARLLALQIEGLNSHRQLLTNQILKVALAQIEKDRSLLDAPVLVASHPAWEAGVIGIVASRLVEMFEKPVVLIAASKDGIGRGSARSLADASGNCLVDINQAIASQASLLLGYGGHTMAAGFSIPVEKIPEFRVRLVKTVERTLAAREPYTPTIAIDAYLDWGEISLELAQELERLAPFGPGNPPLALASRNLRLAGHSLLGREKEHLMLTVEDENGLQRRVIWWNGAAYLDTDLFPQETFDMAYSLSASTFRGQRDLQLEWMDFRPAEGAVIQEKATLEVVDYRQQVYPIAILQRVAKDPTLEPLQVWAEGRKGVDFPLEEVELKTRIELSACKTLVIWTAPPGRAELSKALEMSQAEKVVLFGIDPGDHDPQAFLERLAGMVKYATKRKSGELRIAKIAVALAQREVTVCKGLEWLEARGELRIISRESRLWKLGEELDMNDKGNRDTARSEKALEGLKALLNETRSYRAWFRRSEKIF